MSLSTVAKQRAKALIRDYGPKTARQVTNHLQKRVSSSIGIPEVKTFLNSISGDKKLLLKKKNSKQWVYSINPGYSPQMPEEPPIGPKQPRLF